MISVHRLPGCFFLAFAAFGVALAGAQSAPYTASPQAPDNRLIRAKWHAQWIACPDAPERDAGVYYFRKELNLESVPEHFRVHVSADNRFLLHVNGKYAGEGPARGDLFHWRFETIDLAPLLHPGKNVLAAVVWNFGSRAPVAQITSRTGFLLQGDTPAEEAADTGKSWMAEQEKGRGASAHPGVSGYYAAGPSERMDGREVDWSWDQAEVARAGAWQPAQSIGRAAAREAQDADNPWELTQDLLPPMEHRLVEAGKPVRAEGVAGKAAFPESPLEVPANTKVTLLLDNKILQTAYPELTLSGGRDAEIRLTYAEALYDAKGDKANRNDIEGRHIEGVTDEFTSDGGKDRIYGSLWWRTWRYLQVEVTTKGEPLRLEGLKAWFSAYPFHERARIAADIPDLDALWQTGWRTARLCSHETYMDAPYWEQLQYVGDTRIQALISYAMTGDSRLARQAITNIDTSRTPEGITESRYPSGLPQFIPTFSLLWVNMVHDYWMYVDDEALVRETLPHTRTVMDWYAAHMRPDGLLGRVTWWEFGDWTAGYPDGVPPQDADGGSTFLTLQFVEGLKDAAELEAKFGSPERARQYQETIRKATDALMRMNWDARYGLFADTPAKKNYSREANVLAVWLDAAPKAEQANMVRRILGAKETGESNVDGKAVPPMSEMSFYFRFYLARAMEHAGLQDRYVEQLEPWYGMLKIGLSTWAETPEPTRSDCHAWSASPNYDLLTLVAGIRPAAPGFKRVRIEPHLGKLTHLEATMPHAGGDIRASYEQDGKRWRARIALPSALDGEVVWKGKSYAVHGGEQTLTLP